MSNYQEGDPFATMEVVITDSPEDSDSDMDTSDTDAADVDVSTFSQHSPESVANTLCQQQQGATPEPIEDPAQPEVDSYIPPVVMSSLPRGPFGPKGYKCETNPRIFLQWTYTFTYGYAECFA